MDLHSFIYIKASCKVTCNIKVCIKEGTAGHPDNIFLSVIAYLFIVDKLAIILCKADDQVSLEQVGTVFASGPRLQLSCPHTLY